MDRKELIKKSKNFALILLFAVSILILTVSIINLAKFNIVGKASLKRLKVQGTVAPNLPDGTVIDFRVNNEMVAKGELFNNTYGYDEDIWLKMDDSSTSEKEGYSIGDIVDIYIMDIKVLEFSHIGVSGVVVKDINMPTRERAEIATRAAEAFAKRTCEPAWECSIWSECVDELQSRTCSDYNLCEEDKEETRICAMIQQPVQPEEGDHLVIGILIFLIVALTIVGIVIIIKPRK